MLTLQLHKLLFHSDHTKTFCFSIDCLLNLNNGTNTFGRISPDEAILGSRMLNNIEVLAEVRTRDAVAKPTEYGLVVVVKENIRTAQDLKEKRMCHPGYNNLDLPRYAISKIEDALLTRAGFELCKKLTGTTLEDRIDAMDMLLSTSCLHGMWSDDSEIDQRLSKL